MLIDLASEKKNNNIKFSLQIISFYYRKISLSYIFKDFSQK